MRGLRLLSMLFALTSMPLQAAGQPESELARLFSTIDQRQQIDLERKRALAGLSPEVDLTLEKRLPDIYFQAILFQPGGEPLLWINQQKRPLSQWRGQVELLVLDQLWVQDEMLGIELKGQRWLLKPNQVFNRQLAEVTEVHDYVPLIPVAEPVSQQIPEAPAFVHPVPSPAAENSEGSGVSNMLKNAAALRDLNSNLPQ